jgi:hypothetical protein
MEWGSRTRTEVRSHTLRCTGNLVRAATRVATFGGRGVEPAPFDGYAQAVHAAIPRGSAVSE